MCKKGTSDAGKTGTSSVGKTGTIGVGKTGTIGVGITGTIGVGKTGLLTGSIRCVSWAARTKQRQTPLRPDSIGPFTVGGG